MASIPARDTAFAALGLLRCRDRLEQVLGTIAEPRRSELEQAVSRFAGLDDGRLRRLLVELVQREDAELGDAVTQALGNSGAGVPPVLRRWIARGADP